MNTTLTQATTEAKETPKHHQLSKELKAAGLFLPSMKMNDLLLECYKSETGCNDFRKFNQWKEAGYKVKKGSKGFPVFSRPVGVIKEEKTGQAQNEDSYKFFGTCYLFNESQVEKM